MSASPFVSWLLVLGACFVVSGVQLLRWAVRDYRREKALRRRLPGVSHHHWHVVAPRPYDWQEFLDEPICDEGE